MRSAIPKPYVNFIGGLWTESSPLNHPENTSKVEQNFKLNPDGSRERRLGLKLHDDMADTIDNCCVVESYRWTNAGNTNNRVIVATQVGSDIALYEEDGSCQSDYTQVLKFSLEDYKVCDKPICDVPVDFASGNGYLFIAHGAIQPIYIKYNNSEDCGVDTEGFEVVTVNLYERDFDGVEDGLTSDQNPSTLTPEHRYNLLNQGWTDEYIMAYFNDAGVYPSNNEVWYLGLYTDPDTGIEQWSVDELKKSDYGTANTTRGHFIKNVFDSCDVFESQPTISYTTDLRDCSAIRITFDAPHGLTEDGSTIGIVGSTVAHTYGDPATTEIFDFDGTYVLGDSIFVVNEYMISFAWLEILDSPNWTTDSVCNLQTQPDIVDIDIEIPRVDCCTTCGRPEVTSMYAGRVWYAGIDSTTLGNRVYFSQILRSDREIGRMYQQYDPTARDYNELLKTDGGFIDIPEMGWVRGMETLKDALLIFADNGIWSVTGGTYEYFTATSYSVSKLTEVGVVSKKSIEEIEDTWVYASNRGIYLISSENRVTNITEEAIHSRYKNIPQINKKQIDIRYNPYDKTLHVLHSLDGDNCWRYCTELIINHRIKAWYEYRYSDSFLTHIIATGNDSDDEYGLLYCADTSDSTNRSFFMDNCNYEDWEGTTHVKDAPAYVLTGPELLGDLSIDKKIEDMYVFMRAEPQAGCIFRARWDWSCDDCSGDFTTSQQVFSPSAPCNDKYPHQVARADIKVRGHGRASEIEFSSEPGKPCTIYGWSVTYAGRKRS